MRAGLRLRLARRASHGRAGREPPLAFAFALLATMLALVTMRLLGTPVLDAGAYRAGVGVAAVGGLLTGLAVRALRVSPRLRNLGWALIPISGALVAMTIQWILLARVPAGRTYMLASGLSTTEPVSWVIAGAPFGAVPALVVIGVLVVAVRLVAPPFGVTARSEDTRERMMLPFAAACAVLAAAALGTVDALDLPVVGGVVLLAACALVEILVRDRARVRWLCGIFSGADDAHVVVPATELAVAAELPLVVGNVLPDAVILRIEERPDYRGPARVPIATTALAIEPAIAPLVRRRAALVATFAATFLVGAVAIGARLL